LLEQRSRIVHHAGQDSLVDVPAIRSETRIDATPEQVFDFIDHWPNAMRYLKRMVKWEPTDPNNTKVGGRFDIGVQAGPTRLNGRLEVTGWERPRTIAFRSIDGPPVNGSWALTPDGDGTRVVLDATYQVPGGIAGRLVAAFLRANAQNDLNASLRELKRLVESETGGSGGSPRGG
jgi:uncharacterized membrane protein